MTVDDDRQEDCSSSFRFDSNSVCVNLLLSTCTAVVGIMVSDDREGSVVSSSWTLMIKELQLLLLVV